MDPTLIDPWIVLLTYILKYTALSSTSFKEESQAHAWGVFGWEPVLHRS